MRHHLMTGLAVGSIVMLIWSFQAADVAAGEGKVVGEQPAGQPAAGPLKLEVMVSVVRVPATLVLRATNVSDKDVTLQGFGRDHKRAAYSNYMVIIAPSGKKRQNTLSNPLPTTTLKPGEYKEWGYRVGKSTSIVRERGIHRFRWIVGAQRSREILLRVPDPPARAAVGGPLKLEVMVSVVRVPATLVLRATNVSNDDVTLQGFGKDFKGAAYSNYMVIIAPSGKKRQNTSSNRPPTTTLKPGEHKEWRYRVGKNIITMKEEGIHRFHWIVGAQKSQEVLLRVPARSTWGTDKPRPPARKKKAQDPK
jgi:predicted small secreted protein